MKKFRAPWDGNLWIRVILIVGLYICVSVLAWNYIRHLHLKSHPWLAALVFLPLLALIVKLPRMVRGYSIEGQNLMIERLLRRDSIPLEGLQEVKFDPQIMKERGLMRCEHAGRGNPFAYTGIYVRLSFKELFESRFTAYATDKKRCVVLRFPDRNIVVSPSDTDEFIRQLQPYLMVAKTEGSAGGSLG